jgi:NADH dehydrogenase FAD-containing subunit
MPSKFGGALLMAFEYAEKTRTKRPQSGDDFRDHRRRADRRGNGGRDCGDRALHAGERFSAHRSVEARVIVVEGESVCSRRFPEDLSAKALKQLKELGVEVRTGVHATNLTDAGLQVGDEFIPCRVKVWAAGNTASFVGKSLGAPVDKAGRVIVNDDLTIPGHPEVQVIGDLANFRIRRGNHCPASRPSRCNRAATPRANILGILEGRKPQRFWYWDKGKHGDNPFTR